MDTLAGMAKPKTKPTRKPKHTQKPKPGSEIAAILSRFEFPHPAGNGLCFDEGGDRLFERGYPNMRFLSDEATAPAVAEKQALSALDAIDPELRITVPRALARAFLLGYRVGPLLFVDETHRKENEKLRDERVAMIRSDRAIDLALLGETLEQPHAWGMGETYSRWRWPKVLYLYEAFLGTDPVARAAASYLVRSAADVKRWGFAGDDPNRRNTVHHAVASAMPWLLLRASPKVASEIRRQLAAVPASKKVPTFIAILHWLGAPGTPPPTHGFETLDGAGLEDRLKVAKFELMWNVGRVVWLLGSERLAGELKISGFDLPRMVDALAPLRDPGVVRLMTLISAQRAGKKPAGDWLQKHAKYTRPIASALAKSSDPKQAAAAKGALELLEAGAIAEAPVMSSEELDATIDRIFAALGKSLRATKDEAKRKDAIRAAHAAYTDARAAAGDPIPEAYFTHRFGDYGLGEFGMLAVAAIS